ncbi:MAG: beta-lactamase family protein [Phycisphaerae bacterium]|nr:beta-lactamase family protein [Saprospiraceae bacterium]
MTVRKATLAPIIISLWATGCGLSTSQSYQGESNVFSVFSTVDTYITNEMKAENIPGVAIGIVKDNRIVYLKGYGRSDPSGRLVKNGTPFVIGSITKSFTAMAVMQQVEVGKIALDAPVQHYLPSFRVVGSPEDSSTYVSSSITVRHLLNQTSGLSGSDAYRTAFFTYNGDDALEKTARYYTEGRQLKHPVGKTYAYSNGNYVILGLIVQKVSGQSYESYVKEHVFAPLSMHNTFTSQEEAIPHGMAMGYRRWFGFSLPYQEAPYNRGDLPAGYILSSAEDMSHYLIAQLEGGRYGNVSVLSPAGIDLMHTEPLPGTYAMGWESGAVGGVPVIGHAGGTPGFQSHMWLDTERHLGVIVLANVLSVLDALPKTNVTTATHLASGVMSLVENRLLPDKGMGPAQMYWIVDGVLFLLSGWLVISLAGLTKRYPCLSERSTAGRSIRLRRVIIVFILHFIWPSAVLLTAAAGVPLWKVLTLYQPDLLIWLTVVAAVVLLKGIVEMGLLVRIFRRSRFLKAH